MISARGMFFSGQTVLSDSNVTALIPVMLMVVINQINVLEIIADIIGFEEIVGIKKTQIFPSGAKIAGSMKTPLPMKIILFFDILLLHAPHKVKINLS